MGKFGQVWASLGKLGQVKTRQQIRKIGGKGRKNKKREQKFEWLWRRRRRKEGLEFAETFGELKSIHIEIFFYNYVLRTLGPRLLG